MTDPKLAINKSTNVGAIVSGSEAASLAETHRVVDVQRTGESEAGTTYQDIWNGTWLVRPDGETICTVGAMDKWA